VNFVEFLYYVVARPLGNRLVTLQYCAQQQAQVQQEEGQAWQESG
jgi:hypothetical protein